MNFIDAISYPIRRRGWMMILLGAILSLILQFLEGAPVFGIFAAVFSTGYFGSFFLDIVSSTMTGHDEIPDWPSFTSFVDDIVWPFLRLVGLLLLSFLPTIALFFVDPDESWFLPTLIAALVYGCFYFPMAVLATQAFGRLGAALPNVVFPGIYRALPGYFLAVIALVIGLIVCAVAGHYSAEIPYVGWFLTAAVGLYGLMFQARLIGLLYRDKCEQLAWE